PIAAKSKIALAIWLAWQSHSPTAGSSAMTRISVGAVPNSRLSNGMSKLLQVFDPTSARQHRGQSTPRFVLRRRLPDGQFHCRQLPFAGALLFFAWTLTVKPM